MKFDVYGRFSLEELPTTSRWGYRLTVNKHLRADDIIIPAESAAADSAEYPDDHIHEVFPPRDRIVARRGPGALTLTRAKTRAQEQGRDLRMRRRPSAVYKAGPNLFLVFT